jgi:outer membrane immunogenic protein
MNKVFGSIALLALVTAPAMAADLPAKAPVYKAPPPPVWSWTGFYVGANVGYSWGRGSNDWSFFAPTAPGVTACPPALCAAGSDTTRLNGAIGGLQAGYNWQAGSFVVGLETDFQLSGQKGSELFSTTFSVGIGPPPGTVSATNSEKLTWLGTLRGRIGFTPADRWLVYATGGLAYGRVTVDGAATATGTNNIFGPTTNCTVTGFPALGTCALGAWSNAVTRAGWTLGAGAEGAITGNWSWKIEYLHVDLGRVDTAFATQGGAFGSVGSVTTVNNIAAGTGTISSRITDDIVRVGINYRFAGPLVARY